MLKKAPPILFYQATKLSYCNILRNRLGKLTGVKKGFQLFVYLCGVFSHTKPLDSPSILAPEVVEESICAQAAKTRIYVDETGISHTLSDTNSVLHYKYVSHGSLSYSSSNVYCEGGSSKIMGESHTGVLELRTVRFEIRQATIALRSDGRIQDTLDSEELPSSCRNNAACSTLRKTYNFTSPPEVCPYKKI